MARFNEILVGRFNRGLQKLFGIKGPPPSAQLATEVTVQHPFASGAENRYLEEWHRFGRSNVTAAVAGVNSQFQIRNPAGSNSIGVIEKLSIEVDVAGVSNAALFLITTNIGDLTTLLTPQRLDARIQRTGATMSLSVQTGGAVTGVLIWQASFAVNVLNEVILFEDQELTVLPGDAYRISTPVNTNLTVNCFWRERTLEEGERT